MFTPPCVGCGLGASRRARLFGTERGELVDGCHSHKRINRAAEERHFAKDGANKIKPSGADKSPIDSTNDEEDEG